MCPGPSIKILIIIGLKILFTNNGRELRLKEEVEEGVERRRRRRKN